MIIRFPLTQFSGLSLIFANSITFNHCLFSLLICFCQNSFKMNSTYSPHPLKPYKDLIISTALTGNIPSKLKYPLLPVAPEEISEDAINCMAEGCSVVHIHARDANGMPSHSKALYEDIFGLIRAQSLDIIICASTSSRISRDVNTRLSALEVNPALRPDMASITLGSCNMRETVSINNKSEIIDMLQAFEDLNVKPEFEIFDLGMVYNLLELIMDGRVLGTPIVNILLGNEGTAPAFIGDLDLLQRRLPGNTEWAAAGIGHFQRPMTIAAAVMGGNVRTGLEDNPRGNGKTPWGNVNAVQFAKQCALLVGRSLSSTSATRIRYGLNHPI